MKLLNEILVKPLKDKKYKQVQYFPDKEKNKDLDNITEIKEVVNEVSYEVQRAIVVHMPENSAVGYDIGDVIYYYKSRPGVPFRYLKGTYLIKPYDIIGYETRSTDSETAETQQIS
jgi:hypothetical protein